MVVSHRKPQEQRHAKSERPIEAEELINRMATELRARSDPDFPHSFYVEQVRRQLAGKPSSAPAANDEAALAKPPPEMPTSVFHAWALSE